MARQAAEARAADAESALSDAVAAAQMATEARLAVEESRAAAETRMMAAESASARASAAAEAAQDAVTIAEARIAEAETAWEAAELQADDREAARLTAQDALAQAEAAHWAAEARAESAQAERQAADDRAAELALARDAADESMAASERARQVSVELASAAEAARDVAEAARVAAEADKQRAEVDASDVRAALQSALAAASETERHVGRLDAERSRAMAELERTEAGLRAAVGERDGLQQALESLVREADARVEEAVGQANHLESAAEDLESALYERGLELTGAGQALGHLRAARERHEVGLRAVLGERDGLRESLDALTTEAAAHALEAEKEIAFLESAAGALESALHEREGELVGAAEALTGLREQRVMARGDLARREAGLSAALGERDGLRDALEALRDERDEVLRVAGAELAQLEAAAVELEGACARHSEEQRGAAEALRRLREQCEGATGRNQRLQAAHRAALGERDGLRVTLHALIEQQHGHHEAAVSELEGALEDRRQTLAGAEEAIRRLQLEREVTTRALEQAEDRLAGTAQQLGGAEEAIARFQQAEQEHREARAEALAQERQRELEYLERSASALQATGDSVREQLEGAEQALARYQRAERERGQALARAVTLADQRLDEMAHLEEAIDALQGHLEGREEELAGAAIALERHQRERVERGAVHDEALQASLDRSEQRRAAVEELEMVLQSLLHEKEAMMAIHVQLQSRHQATTMELTARARTAERGQNRALAELDGMRDQLLTAARKAWSLEEGREAIGAELDELRRRVSLAGKGGDPLASPGARTCGPAVDPRRVHLRARVREQPVPVSPVPHTERVPAELVTRVRAVRSAVDEHRRALEEDISQWRGIENSWDRQVARLVVAAARCVGGGGEHGVDDISSELRRMLAKGRHVLERGRGYIAEETLELTALSESVYSAGGAATEMETDEAWL